MRPDDGRASESSASLMDRDKTRLKDQIARRWYRVDAEAVAREILFKLRMISAGRRSLLADTANADQQVPPGAEERRYPRTWSTPDGFRLEPSGSMRNTSVPSRAAPILVSPQ